MKRILRNPSTGEFLTPDGVWCADPKCARNLENLYAALSIRDELALEAAEYVLMIEEAPSSYDVVVELKLYRGSA